MTSAPIGGGSDTHEVLRQALAGRYTIERELGRGGMATVHLARDEKHGRAVALKVLRPELTDLLGRERFLREIATAATLQHPHILPLYDSGSAGDLLYYTMPAVEGETLRARLDRETHLPVDEALALVREVADALSHAHSHGVVHRDIKPENIYLAGGHALVADFGIATAIGAAGGERLTERGLAVGTPAYMSPEQASAADKVDGRSDIYALGCVLYEMLAGEPPFTGRTAQAVLARHLQERPPSLRVVRPTVTLPVQEAIERALAKVPADRFVTATAFAETLQRAERRRWWTRRRVARVAGLAAAGVAAAALWRFVVAPPLPLDANRVVGFPLAEGAATSREGTGYEIALMIGTALEHAEPLRWEDGWRLLSAAERADPATLAARRAEHLTRSRGARWFIDGAAVRRGDSVTVVLVLSDAAGDSVVGRASATRVTAEAAQAGLAAVGELLPRLLAPDRAVDLAPLADRDPGAIANWLQGERAYRQSNFATARAVVHRAVRADSGLAIAALRGAQAASWQSAVDDAERFATLAVAHAGALPRRYAALAVGLAAYLGGQADSARRAFQRALADDPTWPEAHMALGEVFYHLLPDVDHLDSLAALEFLAAARDSGFAPPLFHVAEIAIRSGDVRHAARAVDQFTRFGTGTDERTDLALMLSCARDGGRSIDWRGAAAASPFVVLSVAKMLSVAGAFPQCALDAARTILATPTASDVHFGAFLLLQNLLAAQSRSAAVVSLVDSLKKAGLWQATSVYLVDALAGVADLEPHVPETLAALQRAYGPHYEDSLSRGTRLLLGAWYARTQQLADAERLERALLRQAEAGDSEARLYAKALTAHLLLARGDSDAALAALETLKPAARRDALVWGYTESLAVERMTRARLLYERGRYQDALVAASVFDHPTPVVYVAFLPASLTLRAQAARALGQPQSARRYEARLTELRRPDSLSERRHPTSQRREP